tara:strand:+ start:885 stop:1148 length:264 start_codon:yes stop_codon:yes gene_type:complete
MALNVYIGYARFQRKYYVNRHGVDDMINNAFIFGETEINLLLNHLTEEYGKRKSSLIGISPEITSNVKERIIKHIEKKVKKLEVRLN